MTSLDGFRVEKAIQVINTVHRASALARAGARIEWRLWPGLGCPRAIDEIELQLQRADRRIQRRHRKQHLRLPGRLADGDRAEVLSEHVGLGRLLTSADLRAEQRLGIAAHGGRARCMPPSGRLEQQRFHAIRVHHVRLR